jgi:hypothetical protein
MINGEGGMCASQRRTYICEGTGRGGSGGEDWSV